MYGAILGDMIGAPYEFDRGNKAKDFPLFSRGSQFTDDSVMTIAVAEALMSLKGEADDEAIHHAVSKAMRIWGRNYPDAGMAAGSETGCLLTGSRSLMAAGEMALL